MKNILVNNYITSKDFIAFLLLYACLLLPNLTTPVWAGEPSEHLVPGYYEGLQLAIDPNGRAVGFFSQKLGMSGCSFFLASEGTGADSKITTWVTYGDKDDPSYSGSLIPGKRDSVILTVEHGRDHPGCSNVLGPLIETGLELTRNYKSQWITLKVIKSDRAYFHSEPQENKRRKAYVVRKNVVGVMSIDGDWINAEYYNKGKLTKGWIKLNDTMDVPPPNAALW